MKAAGLERTIFCSNDVYFIILGTRTDFLKNVGLQLDRMSFQGVMRRIVEVLSSSACECDLTGEQGLCRGPSEDEIIRVGPHPM